MDWTERIVTDPNVLVGKPTIKGTRISVELIIDRLADGWSEKDILDSYPRLTREDLRAVFAFIQECMKDGLFISNFAAR
jgi:uncharacterized protein (DUF433 family)